jgi:hypothetical protein
MMILFVKDKSRTYVNPPRSSFPALTLPEWWRLTYPATEIRPLIFENCVDFR